MTHHHDDASSVPRHHPSQWPLDATLDELEVAYELQRATSGEADEAPYDVLGNSGP